MLPAFWGGREGARLWCEGEKAVTEVMASPGCVSTTSPSSTGGEIPLKVWAGNPTEIELDHRPFWMVVSCLLQS